MSYFDTFPLTHNNILSVYADRDRINMSPEYQRQGDIWSTEKKQLLVDSIINRYDIPKLYFHKYEREDAKRLNIDFAVVDGRQRLEAIFGFIDNEFSLADDFEYLEDKTIKAASLTYQDLAHRYPKLKQRFDAFALPIICITTDDLDLIEDLFFRLNEAVPLNAAEKRNAIGGFLAKTITEVAEHAFFKKKIRFGNKRYQHREVAARLLFLELCLTHGRILDTKKPLLDEFTRQYKNKGKAEVAKLQAEVIRILGLMTKVFVGKDILLASQSSVPIYYLVYRNNSLRNGSPIPRERLAKFNDARQINRELAAKDIGKSNYELLEYDRMSQQGTNDASSIRERYRIISSYLKLPSDPITALGGGSRNAVRDGDLDWV